MAMSEDKIYLKESITYFAGMGNQIHYILDANYDKFKTSQVTRFVKRYTEIIQSVSSATTERAKARAKEEEEVRRKYRGSELQNRLSSIEANANITHGKTLTDAGDKLKDICEDMEAAAGVKTTPVSATVKKLSRQKMSPSKRRS